VNNKGNPSPARLSVRVTHDSTSAVAGNAVGRAHVSVQKLIGPVVVATVSNAATNISNTVSNQQNLITSFESLMKKVGVLVKIGDDVAKVCSSVSNPWLHDRNWSFKNFCLKKDSSVRQFGVASAFRRNEGKSMSIILVVFPHIIIYIGSIRWSKPNTLETSRF
jgi:hypothetical protein